ncbi:MAG TPA: hypothetical protein VIM02_15445 [Rhizomicrobium sp.]
MGLWLAGADDARTEALRDIRDLLAIAILSGDKLSDCEYQITNADGDTIWTIPLESPGLRSEPDDPKSNASNPRPKIVH